MLFKKHIIFYIISVFKPVFMARRKLGLLKNLGKLGLVNTKKTMKEKAEKEASKPTPQHNGKENRAHLAQ